MDTKRRVLLYLGGGVAVSYQGWQPTIGPTFLKGPNGLAWAKAHGKVKDWFAQQLKCAIYAALPGVDAAGNPLAPDDGLALIGAERQLPRVTTSSGVANETPAAYATRLMTAWDAWAAAGSPKGLMAALSVLGYTAANGDPMLVQQNGRAWRQSVNDGNGNMLPFNVGTNDLLIENGSPQPWWWTDDVSTMWSRFAVVFPLASLPSGWSASVTVSPPTPTSTPTDSQVAAMVAAIDLWKPAKSVCTGIYVSTSGGQMWGWPMKKWGDAGLKWSGNVTISTVASSLSQADNVALATDGVRYYWTSYDGGTVSSVPLGGGATTVLASTQNFPYGIATDGVNVYWANLGSGTICKVPVGGGATTTLASGQTGASGVAVFSGKVYWTAGSNICTCPAAAGATRVIYAGATVAWGIAVDRTAVYWTQNSASHPAVMRMPLRFATSPTNLSAAQSSAICLAGGNVYFAGLPNLYSVPTGGGATTPVQLGFIRGITTDGAHLYWVNTSNGGTAYRANLDGTGITAIATGETSDICGIAAASSSHVAWGTATATGTIREYVETGNQHIKWPVT